MQGLTWSQLGIKFAWRWVYCHVISSGTQKEPPKQSQYCGFVCVCGWEGGWSSPVLVAGRETPTTISSTQLCPCDQRQHAPLCTGASTFPPRSASSLLQCFPGSFVCPVWEVRRMLGGGTGGQTHISTWCAFHDAEKFSASCLPAEMTLQTLANSWTKDVNSCGRLPLPRHFTMYPSFVRLWKMTSLSTAVFYSLRGPWPHGPFTLNRRNLYLASKHKSSGRLEVRPGSPPAKISPRSTWLCVAGGESRSAQWRELVFAVPVWVWQSDDVTLEECLYPTSGSAVIRSRPFAELTKELGSRTVRSRSLSDPN